LNNDEVNIAKNSNEGSNSASSNDGNISYISDDNEFQPDPLLTVMHPASALQGRYSDYHTMRIQIQGIAKYHLSPIQYDIQDNGKQYDKQQHDKQQSGKKKTKKSKGGKDDTIMSSSTRMYPSIHRCAHQTQVNVSLLHIVSIICWI